jgi:hypothetical protein
MVTFRILVLNRGQSYASWDCLQNEVTCLEGWEYDLNLVWTEATQVTVFVPRMLTDGLMEWNMFSPPAKSWDMRMHTRKATMNTVLIVLQLDHVSEWPIHQWNSAKPSLRLIMDVIYAECKYSLLSFRLFCIQQISNKYHHKLTFIILFFKLELEPMYFSIGMRHSKAGNIRRTAQNIKSQIWTFSRRSNYSVNQTFAKAIHVT